MGIERLLHTVFVLLLMTDPVSWQPAGNASVLACSEDTWVKHKQCFYLFILGRLWRKEWSSHFPTINKGSILYWSWKVLQTCKGREWSEQYSVGSNYKTLPTLWFFNYSLILVTMTTKGPSNSHFNSNRDVSLSKTSCFGFWTCQKRA